MFVGNGAGQYVQQRGQCSFSLFGVEALLQQNSFLAFIILLRWWISMPLPSTLFSQAYKEAELSRNV